MTKKEYDKLYYEENKERIKLQTKKYKDNHKEKYNEYSRKWRASNKDKSAASQRSWRKKNPKAHREILRKYRNNNKPRRAHLESLRRMRTRKAMPPWVDKPAIIDIYEKAARMTSITGIRHEVDHIWPIAGSGFTGLHVPWNLQIITEHENRTKYNKRPHGIR